MYFNNVIIYTNIIKSNLHIKDNKKTKYYVQQDKDNKQHRLKVYTEKAKEVSLL